MSELFDWLVDGTPGATTSAEIVEQCGERLRAEGVVVDRLSAVVMTLHPDVAGRTFAWRPGDRAKVGELTWAQIHSHPFETSPVALVVREQREVRRRICDGARDFAILGELAEEGFTDYLAQPMVFTTGAV